MIIPSASNQMGPGGYGLGSPVIPIAQKGLVVGAQVGLTVISLVGVGKFLKAARVISAVDAALVRLYQTGRIPWLGASTYYPPGWIGPASTIGVGTLSTWFTPDSSSGGGGPGEIPNLHRYPPSIEETGEILSNPSIVGEVPSSPRSSSSSKTGKRRKSCPPGYRWNGRRCVKKG
jgi:hypothetical protein